MRGWGGRIRTSVWRNQNPLPYRLATPQLPRRCRRRPDHSARSAAPQPRGSRALFATDGRRLRAVRRNVMSRIGFAAAGELMQPQNFVSSGLAACVRLDYKSAARAGSASGHRSVAQSGSAPRSGRGGRRFESSHSDQLSHWSYWNLRTSRNAAAVAQVGALDALAPTASLYRAFGGAIRPSGSAAGASLPAPSAR